MSATKRRSQNARKHARRRPLTIVVAWSDWEPEDFDGFRRALCGLVGAHGQFLLTHMPVPSEGPFAGRSDIEIRQVDPSFDRGALMADLRRVFEERGGKVATSEPKPIETA